MYKLLYILKILFLLVLLLFIKKKGKLVSIIFSFLIPHNIHSEIFFSFMQNISSFLKIENNSYNLMNKNLCCLKFYYWKLKFIFF